MAPLLRARRGLGHELHIELVAALRLQGCRLAQRGAEGKGDLPSEQRRPGERRYVARGNAQHSIPFDREEIRTGGVTGGLRGALPRVEL